MLLQLIVAYCAPVTIWIIWKKKSNTRIFPLVVGMIAYMFISVLRAMARIFVLNDELRTHVWLFYVVSALLSGIFEEVGRYVVFRWCIPNHDRWTDCISYGIGHGGIEVFLTSNVLEYNIYSCFLTGSSFVRAIFFSAAMSVLVFTTVHHADHKKYLLLAIGLHTLADILPAFFLNGVITMGETDFLDHLYIVGVCYLAYRVFRHFHPKEVYDFPEDAD